MRWKQTRKLRRLLPLALILIIFSNAYFGILSGISVRGDAVEMSPGKILPENYNHYLGTSDVQVKLEFSRAIVLQQTKGDLLFNVTVERPKRSIEIYIPLEFGISRGSRYVWTSITNDYGSISMSGTSVRVSGDISNTRSNIIRVFNVTAPSIVGQYFFKVFTDGVSIGAENFPALVVSADINPAYISGTVLDGNRSRYALPIELEDGDGGRVVAEGITPEGRRVVGQAFFNSSANGRYTIYGLATGTYTLIASAAGYYNSTRLERVSVVAGQSFEGADIFVCPSPILEGIVWSKCGGMLVPWGAIAEYPNPGYLGRGGAALVAAQGKIYALRGVGTSNFLEYDPNTNEWSSFPPSTPGLVGDGGALTFDYFNSTIYALGGGDSESFWSYSLGNQMQGPWQVASWQSQNDTPAGVGSGGALAFDGQYIYALGGDNPNNFWRYDPDPLRTGNRWDPLADTPDPGVGVGGSLAYDSANGLLYAFGGGASFWSYNIAADAWTDLSPLTLFSLGAGGSLVYNSNDGKLYALAGGGNGFYVYDGSTWTQVDTTSTPASVGAGGSLVFNPSDGKFYVLRGGDTTDFWSYDPSTNTWTSLLAFPSTYARSITIEILDWLGNSIHLIQGSTDPDSSRFDFSYDGIFDSDDHIPQDYSGYISGIAPGTYIIRVWVNQYVQVDTVQLPGTVTLITGFQVQLSGCGTTTRIQLDVYRTGRAEILVHFKNFPEQIDASPVDSTRALTVSLYDYDTRVLFGRNSTNVYAGDSSSLVIVTGFLGTSRDYGLPMGTYIVGVTMNGYYQPYDAFVTIGECGSVGQVSLELIRTGSLNITIQSVDWQHPTVLRNWCYNGATIGMGVRDQYGVQIYASNSTRQDNKTAYATLSVTGLRTGVYSIYVFTFGYVQTGYYTVSVMDGSISDTTVKVMVGSVLDLTVVFEKEDVFTTIDTYPYSHEVPIRVQVLNSLGEFVAANISYVSDDVTTFNIQIAGFRNYAGNYADWRWVNYYDTTDGAFQRDYGLGPDSYTFLVYVPGFMQSEIPVTAQVSADGVSSVILHLDRLAHFYGNIYSFNMFDELVPLNWVTVDAIGEKMHDFAPTLDGRFDMWLDEGHYLVICSLDGYKTIAREIDLPKGSEIPIELYMNPLQS